MARLRFRLYTPIAPYYSWERLSRAWAEMRRINALPERDRTLVDKFYLWALRKRWDREVQRYGGGVDWRASVGTGVAFPHGLNGVHIAENTRIGDGCTILQNVTIGIGSDKGAAPIVGRNVFIGAGTNIIGRTEIGDGAKIGAGVVLTNVRVPAGAVIVNKSAYDLTNKRYIYPQD